VFFSCGGGGNGSETPVTGNLSVRIVGLPNGVSGAVTVAGPNGSSQTLGATQTLSDLTPGTYTVIAANVSVGKDAFVPLLNNQAVAVSAGTTASATVTYSGPLTVSLALQQIAPGLSRPFSHCAGHQRLSWLNAPEEFALCRRHLVTTPFLDISNRLLSLANAACFDGLSSAIRDQRFFFVFQRPQWRYSNRAIPGLPIPTWLISQRCDIDHSTSGIQQSQWRFAGVWSGWVSYVGMGDGGGAGASAQNLNSLLESCCALMPQRQSCPTLYIAAVQPLRRTAGSAQRNLGLWITQPMALCVRSGLESDLLPTLGKIGEKK
jgi:hypothetical protein